MWRAKRERIMGLQVNFMFCFVFSISSPSKYTGVVFVKSINVYEYENLLLFIVSCLLSDLSAFRDRVTTTNEI